MPINHTGGNRTKKQKRNCHKHPAMDKLGQNQMFAKIIQNQGNHFTLLCSDNIQRTAPVTGTVRKRCPRLNKESFVVIETTDQTYCAIISIANPPSSILKLFKQNDPNQEDDFEFDTADNEFDNLIMEQKKDTMGVEYNDVSELLGISKKMNVDEEYDDVSELLGISKKMNVDEEYDDVSELLGISKKSNSTIKVPKKINTDNKENYDLDDL
jgi:translation initiation factor IF-1